MTTLAADALRTFEIGDVEEYPVIAADAYHQPLLSASFNASGRRPAPSS